jgi:hypothetical protein
VNYPFDDEFDPTATTRNMLRWARAAGAETLGDAYDLLEQLELSNDVPEVLGDDGTIDEVRDDIELGLEIAGPDTPLTALE